ncbi:hypothetical protein PR202_gb18115 [Eleusine coracana subsp. coracana]|uniref:Pentatricopeptide repeat-containing protein n=1 Tax=Eleusine coracana subsp. coracana TaxID=191504 RepID=A0AAV5F4G0_ELECO|nr:hypothetical protein QOZ80_6BG0458980 [Eleusine coracana subsp. coracana]GJN29792.1 hypothetical protein PR202_gb18047 [Eleusine coracana subsp. coracana]GJN29855.1 hypothetical protein PR202_gb18115 [Eleusine coracana subsp. coracana]
MAYPPPPPPHGSKAAPYYPLRLHGHGLPSDARGLRSAIKSLSTSTSTSNLAPAAHAHATKLGLDRDVTVRNALISLYLAAGHPSAAHALFDSFPGRDVVSWTAMVTGLTNLGSPRSAAALFLASTDADELTVDAVAAAAGFAACADTGDLALATAAHRRVGERHVVLDSVAWNAVIDMYARCGDLSTARRLFRDIPPKKRNVVTWNTMIAALTRTGLADEALSLFREMQAQRGAAQPDDATLVAVLGACARLGALDAGMWIHAYHMNRNTKGGSVIVGNALIDMYAKCGAPGHAVAVFDGMPRRDAYTYASMVAGLAAHGKARDALALFHDGIWREAGVARGPNNGVALLGALSACCHAGLVDDGLRLLKSAAEDGGAPGIEHYGCAVDMLGRAGRLDDAEALVAAMPFEPDEVVWGSLMAACRARGDVERAERLMRLMDGNADAGDHVMLANAYAARGRHGKAVGVRREMRRRKIVKEPGCSLIEIDGVVHEFRAVPANSSSIT